jgi:hypothetical protein
LRSSTRRLFSVCCTHFRGPRFAALEAPATTQRDRRWVLPGVCGHILDLARRNIHDQLAELIRIAWAPA